MIKRYRKILICAAVIIIAVIGGLYVKKEFAIRKSIENYHAAEDSEKNEDYHKAYELYSLVIPDDLANFKKARTKIDELDKRFEVNKMAALGFEILKQVKQISSLDDLESIQVNTEDSKMTCMIDGIGYAIYKGTGNSNQYQKAIMSADGTYCVMKYEAKKEYGGWLSNDINMINQDTSLTLFKAAALTTSADLISEKLMQEYVEEDEKAVQ